MTTEEEALMLTLDTQMNMNTSPWRQAGYNWYSGLQGPTEEAIIRLRIASMNLFDMHCNCIVIIQ